MLISLPTSVAKAEIEHVDEVLKAQAKEALSLRLRTRPITLRPQMTAPPKAVSEGDHYNCKEFLKLLRASHMGRFKVESLPLQMAKETLDTPAFPVNFQGLFPREMIAHNHDFFFLRPFHGTTSEKEMESKDVLFGWRFLAGKRGIFLCTPPAHSGVLFNPNNVDEALLIEPREPFFAYKFAIHGKHLDVFCRDNFEEPFHQSDPLFLIGISSFAFLWQDLPCDRDRDLANDDCEDKEVDRLVTEFPVGSVKSEEIAVLGFWDALQDEFADRGKTKLGA